ncbi:hypothetical protein XENORESO_015301 [Xenotaenia resolanae]|uniref:Uncharacterized protein n=1 Tax=Xenotaenia resolanae TaxID=208358 RepID=A0ABV0WB92_9TELE
MKKKETYAWKKMDICTHIAICRNRITVKYLPESMRASFKYLSKTNKQDKMGTEHVIPVNFNDPSTGGDVSKHLHHQAAFLHSPTVIFLTAFAVKLTCCFSLFRCCWISFLSPVQTRHQAYTNGAF